MVDGAVQEGRQGEGEGGGAGARETGADDKERGVVAGGGSGEGETHDVCLLRWEGERRGWSVCWERGDTDVV